MALKQNNKFDYTAESLSKIDWLLPKLKFSVLPTKLINWLENFEKKDLPLVYDFLQVFEYITYSEFQYRLEDQLIKIFSELNDTDKVLVVPYGKFGKSGTLVSYPLTHSTFYEKMRAKKRIYITNDYEKFLEAKIDCVIFLDDFIGSGETFCDEYKYEGLKKWADNEHINSRYLLAAIIMKEGKQKIEAEFSEIKIFAQIRNKLFEKGNSVLEALGDLLPYEDLEIKSEKSAKVESHFMKGYSGSESMVAFTHCTPDNTLPIFWWDKNWVPLFPRHAEFRMDEAREFKKEIAFYIGICNRLGIDLLKLDKGIFVSNKNGYVGRKRKYNTKFHHSIIALIKLKLDGFEDYIISQILGLTDEELGEVYGDAFKMGFTDLTNQLTNNAHIYYKKLQRKIAKEKFREPTEENLQMKNINYLPLSFKGLT